MPSDGNDVDPSKDNGPTPKVCGPLLVNPSGSPLPHWFWPVAAKVRFAPIVVVVWALTGVTQQQTSTSAAAHNSVPHLLNVEPSRRNSVADFSPQPRNPNQPKTKQQHGGGFGGGRRR